MAAPLMWRLQANCTAMPRLASTPTIDALARLLEPAAAVQLLEYLSDSPTLGASQGIYGSQQRQVC